MGNSNQRSSVAQSNSANGVYKRREDCFDQAQSDAASHRSVSSNNSGFSFCRSNSRASNRSTGSGKKTSANLYDASKESWPLSQLESCFLPAFPVHLESKRSNFEIIEEVANGAFGKVFKVQEVTTGDVYALKVLSKSKVIKENAIQQVKEEVQIQKACGHHGFIVNCPFHWQSKRHLYIVSDFVEGGELHQLLKIYVILPVALVQLYVAQIALVLDFLHNAGIIYRDLKPENILLDRDGNIQVTDFGLSKWLPYGHKTKTICGTLKYIAPEVLHREPYGHAADWWSLGMIACIMLTGQFPNLDPPYSEKGALRRVILPKEAGVDVPSKDLLLRLLEIEPSKRMRSLRTLLTIAFYKGYNIEEVKHKKVNPHELLRRFYPHGPPSCENLEGFEVELNPPS